jgi:hypothetical protein
MDKWADLCQKLRDAAEGYAVTDSELAWRYREEADDFCRLKKPLHRAELEIREVLAKSLQLRWGERISRLRQQ